MILFILLMTQQLPYIEPSNPSPQAITTPVISTSEQYYNRLYNHITPVPLIIPVTSDSDGGVANQGFITSPSLNPRIAPIKNIPVTTKQTLFNTGQNPLNTVNYIANEAADASIPFNAFGIYPQLVQQYAAVDHLLPQNIVAVQPIGIESTPLAAIVQLNDGRHVVVLLPQNETATLEPTEVTTNSIEKDAELINTKEKLVKAELKTNNEYISQGIGMLPLENEINTNQNIVNFDIAKSSGAYVTPYNNQRQNTPYNNQGQNTPYNNQRQNTPYNNQGQNTPYNNQGQNTPYNNQRQNTPFNNQGQNTPYNNQRQNTPYNNQRQNTPYIYNNQKQNCCHNRIPNQIQGLKPPPSRYVLQDTNIFLLRNRIRDIEITTPRPLRFVVARPLRSLF